MIEFGNITDIKYMEFDNSELICNYRNCRHKNKEHDGKKCKCRHIQNSIGGIGFQPKAIMIWDNNKK
jgi:hypothetical protein